MLTFIAAVATAIAVILLFVYIIRINRTRAKYLNDDSMQKLAQKAADKAVKNDPFVTCDFCGARIDTRTQVTCPQCGGAYGKDTEWSDRHVPDVEKASKHARKQYSTLHAKVKEQNKPTVKKIRILLALLIAGILVSIGLFVYSGIQKEQEKLKDQQVEKYYEPTDYGFGNVSILDDDIIEVCVGNVYARKNYKGLYDYSVELNIINHSKDVLEIGVLVNEKNGHKTIALMQSRVPADNSWHRKILKVSDVEEPYLKTMRVESVIAKLLSYTPVAGTGTNQMIVSTADYELE